MKIAQVDKQEKPIKNEENSHEFLPVHSLDTHPRRRNVTTSMVGLKNDHIRNNLTQNGEPQRYSWEMQKKKKKKKLDTRDTEFVVLALHVKLVILGHVT